MILRISVSAKTRLPSWKWREFQRIAAEFKSRIWLRKGGATADAKDFAEVSVLLDAQGKGLEISAEGIDALKALEVLSRLAAPIRFGAPGNPGRENAAPGAFGPGALGGFPGRAGKTG